MNGQMLGVALGSRRSGEAEITVVISSSRSSTRRPCTTGSSSLASHSGVRLSTEGMCAKLYQAGGDDAAHSRDGASHGSGPAGVPLQKDRTMFRTNIATAIAT